MAIEEVVNASGDAFSGIILEIGRIGLWLQALGVIVIAWVVFQIINYLINRKKMKEIFNIKEDMKRMEEKLDLVVRNVK